MLFLQRGCGGVRSQICRILMDEERRVKGGGENRMHHSVLSDLYRVFQLKFRILIC